MWHELDDANFDFEIQAKKVTKKVLCFTLFLRDFQKIVHTSPTRCLIAIRFGSAFCISK